MSIDWLIHSFHPITLDALKWQGRTFRAAGQKIFPLRLGAAGYARRTEHTL